MTGPELSNALQTLGLDTQAAAKWLGVSVRAVQRYRVSGAPKMAERLLRIACAAERSETFNCYLGAEIGWATCIRFSDLAPSLALDWRE